MLFLILLIALTFTYIHTDIVFYRIPIELYFIVIFYRRLICCDTHNLYRLLNRIPILKEDLHTYLRNAANQPGPTLTDRQIP